MSDGSESEGGHINPYLRRLPTTLSIPQQRRQLPIFKHREQILYLLEQHPVLLVTGKAGCGKSTQIPQYLFEAGWNHDGKRIACVQELNSPLGNQVICRFDPYDNDGADITAAVVYTTGESLIWEVTADPLLTDYSVVVVENVHERQLHIDIVLGLLKRIRKLRPELRLVITSGTPDLDKFARLYQADPAKPGESTATATVHIETQHFPLDVHFLSDPCDDYIAKALETVQRIHNAEPAGSGSILVFFADRLEVKEAVATLRAKTDDEPATRGRPTLEALPLYIGLHPDDQQRALEAVPDRSVRRAIFTTGPAELTLALEGITYVIDSGWSRQTVYDPYDGAEIVQTVPVSQLTALNRARLAGRSGPGKVYRLYTAATFENDLPLAPAPEIQRLDLAAVLLHLKALGIDRLGRFPFIDRPPASTVAAGLELLHALGAIDPESVRLTVPTGERLAQLPYPPMLGRALLASVDMGCTQELAMVASLLYLLQPNPSSPHHTPSSSTGANVWSFPRSQRKEALEAHRRFAVREGDVLTLLNVIRGFITHDASPTWCRRHFVNYHVLRHARSLYLRTLDQMARMWGRPVAELPSSRDPVVIRRCFVRGYFPHAARMQPDGSFELVRPLATVSRDPSLAAGGRSDGAVKSLYLHPDSILFKAQVPYVVFESIRGTTKRLMRHVTAIDPAWLTEDALEYFQSG
ncbi:hypothetical protein IWQ60_000078 [Tieghemiomyces parasiticus]|uniref:Uncharacterized protein n=1 Tax=Tieghemiomyces parasiticus TaxID=78921 RepID=A0A9W8ALW1_9FUNG|nr:hypothetical protein IWQ60_000078 [Tieghemiomyces parasiticus]